MKRAVIFVALFGADLFAFAGNVTAQKIEDSKFR
jgi:hypothetical protein